MPLLARTVNTPLIIEVRRGAIADLGPLLADQRISAGGDVAVVVGPGQGERIVELIRPTLGAADVFMVSGGTLDAAVELGDKLPARSYDAVIGIGGGKTIDTAKYAATRYGMPMVSVATSLANDGIASPIATLDHNGGRPSYGVHIPIAVMVDLDFVETGPDLQNRAGVGELLQQHQRAGGLGTGPAGTRRAGGRARRHARPYRRRGDHQPPRRHERRRLRDHPRRVPDRQRFWPWRSTGSSRPCSGGCHEIMARDAPAPARHRFARRAGRARRALLHLPPWRPRPVPADGGACTGTACRCCPPTSG